MCELAKGPLLFCSLIPRFISPSTRIIKLPQNMTKPETITIQKSTLKKKKTVHPPKRCVKTNLLRLNSFVFEA